MKKSYVAPSVVIIIVLGMQASTFVTGTKVWPFMAYAMYAVPRKPMARQWWVKAEMADGREMKVSPETMGVRFFAWDARYVKPLKRKKRPEGVPAVFDRVAEIAGERPVRLIVTWERHEATTNGIEVTTGGHVHTADGRVEELAHE